MSSVCSCVAGVNHLMSFDDDWEAIERCDVCNRFSSDAEAALAVHTYAYEKSPPAYGHPETEKLFFFVRPEQLDGFSGEGCVCVTYNSWVPYFYEHEYEGQNWDDLVGSNIDDRAP